MSASRTSIDLTGPWRFRQVVTPHSAPDRPVGEEWMRAAVPGCVHTDLLASGRIADPFVGQNERDQQWIEHSDWEYERTFAADEALLARAQVELVFDGLDTYASVLLNGAPVLDANNMFSSWRAEVGRLLKLGDNRITVRFRSPIAEVGPAYDALGYVLPAVNDQAKRMVSMFTRKAPYHFGWDWGPRFVTSGIWRPVRLEAWDGARIENVHVRQTELTDDRARLQIRAEVLAVSAVSVTLTARVGEAAAASVPVTLAPGVRVIDVEVTLEKPERWWPNGLGAPHLYPVSVELTVGSTVVDSARTRVGLRTIDVLHRDDADGKSFTVHVNGRPVFMKGANYIPSDSFLPRVTETRYRDLIASSAAAHMNMLRVWGGGVYEDDRFYDLCDEYGLLVWQDFMFACSMYPGDEAFVENVRREAIENVRRLRNHACLALWAGNNEIEVAWHRWAWPEKFHLSREAQSTLSRDYERLFHRVLPEIVAEHDPSRFYTRSSPSANDDRIVPDTIGYGDMHYWGVWHAESPYEEYATHVSRFMSEYGFQSFPEIRSVERYAEREDFRIDSPVMLAHQRHPRGNELVKIYMERDFRSPKDFESFLYVSQVLQGLVIQAAAEAHRRAMPYCAGSLYWQLCDCWPVASWSGMDYFGRWKALHYFAARFFASVLLSVVEHEGVVSVHAVSDHADDRSVHLALRLMDFDGAELWSRGVDCVIRGSASTACFSGAGLPRIDRASAGRVVLVAEARSPDGPIARGLHFFRKTKDLGLPDPGLTLEVAARGQGHATLRVGAQRLARHVRLTAGNVDGRFSDNYFDLLPGEAATVEWTGPSDASFEVSSIRDTYLG